jgi:hypothetical protein
VELPGVELPGSVIKGLRGGEELVAIDAGGAEESGKLPHQVRAVFVENLEAAWTVSRGTPPGDGFR